MTPATPQSAITRTSFQIDVPGIPLNESTEATIRWRMGKNW